MKKLTIFVLTLLAQSALANHYFTGPYARLGLGGTLADFDIKQSLSDADPSVQIYVPANDNLQDVSVNGLVGLGYSYQFKSRIVIGAEVTADFLNGAVAHGDNLSIFTTSFRGTLEATLMQEYGLLFHGGYTITPKTQLYVLIGPRWGNFKTVLNITGAGSSANDKTSGIALGFSGGLGMKHLITENLTLGLEYAYTDYGSIDSPHAVITVPGFANYIDVNDDTEIKASSNTLLLDLTYYF